MADESYNKELVTYCAQCLWIGNVEKIIIGNETKEYCPYCGSTHFKKATIEEWETLFEKTYNQGKYLNINKPWEQIIKLK